VEKTLRKDKHLESNIGEDVVAKLFKPLDNSKQYHGKLTEFNEKILKIEIDKGIIEIERKNIATIKTVYNWE